MNLPSFWTQSTTDTLIATAITAVVVTMTARLWSWMREPIRRLATMAMKKLTASWQKVVETILDVVLFFVLTWWVQRSITSTEPLTRIAVFEIAFWTFWLLAFTMHLVFFKKRPATTA